MAKASFSAYIPNVSESTTTEAEISAPRRWEFADQWARAWARIKWAVTASIIFAGVLAAGQIFLFYQMFAEIHWGLGLVFVVTALAVIARFIGWPLYKFFQTPSIAVPPAVELTSPEISIRDVAARAAYDAAYLDNAAGNPALAGHETDIATVRGALAAFNEDLSKAAPDAAGEKGAWLAAFERDQIAPLLNDLDKKVDQEIRKESLSVGTATAVSMNGSIDAFIVLWRNVNMVSRISRLYYGRPSLRLSILILRDVMAAVLLSRALDDVADTAGEALGGLFTRFGGLVMGPMIDGSVNALVTLKIGQLAKRRCRSFDVWSQSKAQQALGDVLDLVKRESGGVIGELAKASGRFLDIAADAADGVIGAATSTADIVMSAPRSAWSMVQDVFVRKPKTANDAEPT